MSKLAQLAALFSQIENSEDPVIIKASAKRGSELVEKMMTNNDILLGTIEELESMALDMYSKKRKVDAG